MGGHIHKALRIQKIGEWSGRAAGKARTGAEVTKIVNLFVNGVRSRITTRYCCLCACLVSKDTIQPDVVGIASRELAALGLGRPCKQVSLRTDVSLRTARSAT
jgi:hypothetical protein